MEIGSIVGFILGAAFLVWSLFDSAGYDAAKVGIFWNVASIVITFGGTVASTLIGIKFDVLLKAFPAAKVVFVPPKLNPASTIEQIVALANTARKEGVLALEESADSMEDAFLKKGIMLIVDGTDPELVKGIMETELAYIDERHNNIAGIYEYIASQGPAWGMIGTLIGLIIMLLDLNDPTTLGPKMAIALITTFYGSVLANYAANPIANKMKQISKEEILLKTVLIEGMLSIQAGENPRIIEEKLKSFLSPALRGAAAEGKGGKGTEDEE